MRLGIGMAAFLCIGSIGNTGWAWSEKLYCKENQEKYYESAVIDVMGSQLKVQMSGTSCLLTLSDSQEKEAGSYRYFLTGDHDFCEWGDRFDVTALVGIRMKFLGDLVDVSEPVIFNFSTASDTGGHTRSSSTLVCTRIE